MIFFFPPLSHCPPKHRHEHSYPATWLTMKPALYTPSLSALSFFFTNIWVRDKKIMTCTGGKTHHARAKFPSLASFVRLNFFKLSDHYMKTLWATASVWWDANNCSDDSQWHVLPSPSLHNQMMRGFSPLVQVGRAAAIFRKRNCFGEPLWIQLPASPSSPSLWALHTLSYTPWMQIWCSLGYSFLGFPLTVVQVYKPVQNFKVEKLQ